MALEDVRAYLSRWDRQRDILEMDESTATVPLAARALGVEEARIAKSLTLKRDGSALVLVTAGDARVDNRKYKERFGFKAGFVSGDDAHRLTGHPPGGVCPFALPGGVEVYLDVSLQRFDTVFPACGAGNTAIELTMRELEEYAGSAGWVDVCACADAATSPR